MSTDGEQQTGFSEWLGNERVRVKVSHLQRFGGINEEWGKELLNAELISYLLTNV